MDFLAVAVLKAKSGEFSFNRQGSLVRFKQVSERFAGFAGAGYMHTGEPIDETKINQIEDGTTTKDQVENLFGSPGELAVLRDGSVLWIYEYKKFGKSVAWAFIPGGGLKKHALTCHQILEMRFKDEIVINHNYAKPK